ncbi:hypothetical protein GCM10022226_68160 [Sphaerisporangium flaviroseum]|uniref:DUF397 domain-containing protein n=1 Tax=Sphaerisporangium flaviroseum TaxID=509199 RepID=A0ABP7J8E6_9ACTN
MADDLQGGHWQKSSFSTDQGTCVEITSNLPGIIRVRDSKNPAGPVLRSTPIEWAAFLDGIKRDTLGP